MRRAVKGTFVGSVVMIAAFLGGCQDAGEAESIASQPPASLEPAVMPDLAGMTADEAIGALEEAGIVSNIQVMDDFVGTIAWQSPKPGESLGENEAVEVKFAD